MSKKTDWIQIPQPKHSPSVRVPKPKEKKPSGVLSERHSRAQEPFYDQWIEDRRLIQVVFDENTAIAGYLTQYDTYALQIVSQDGVEMIVFKHAVRFIHPLDPDWEKES